MQVSVLGTGEYFGEVESFNETQRASAAISVTECTLLVLGKSWLETMPSAVSRLQTSNAF
jgi:hypothetical protein